MQQGITDLLRGGSAANVELWPVVYRELKTLARAVLRGRRRPGGPKTTTLVHEAYLRLVGASAASCRRRWPTRCSATRPAVIFLDKCGALASATIYTLLLGVIAVCNWERVGKALRALIVPGQEAPRTLGQKARVILVALLLMGLLFVFDQLLVNLFGHGRG